MNGWCVRKSERVVWNLEMSVGEYFAGDLFDEIFLGLLFYRAHR